MTENTHVDDPRVAAVLAAASAPAEAPLPGEAEALAAFRSVLQPRRRLHLMSRKSENAKLVAAAVFGGLVVLSGAAAAATGNLPGVHDNGPKHPTPAVSHSPDAGDQNDNETQAPASTQDSAAPTQTPTHGSEVSATAHSITDGHKGPVVCKVASQGKCHAGEHGTSTQTHGKSALPHGKAGQSHGQSDATTHGQSGATTHGQSGLTTHGQSGAITHGKAGLTTHGQSGATTHGKAGQVHGKP